MSSSPLHRWRRWWASGTPSPGARTSTPPSCGGTGCGGEPGSAELGQFAAEYATFIGARLLTGGRNIGLSTLIDTVAADPALVTIVSTDWPLPEHSETRLVPLRPMPYYPWYLIWPRTAAHPFVPALRHSLRAAGRIPDLHAADVWLPAAVDRDGAPSASP